jgi:hypothetical protein
VALGEYWIVRYMLAKNGSDTPGDGSRSKPWAAVAHALAEPKLLGSNGSAGCAGMYRGETLQLKANVDLFGGYDLASWHRDIVRHASVLDGEALRRVVEGSDHARLDGFTRRRLVLGRAGRFNATASRRRSRTIPRKH